MQTRIPCVLMRGGTSKGPFFLASDLPDDAELRNQVLLKVMGSPDNRQIDGIGGADSLTSKVAIVSPSARDDADVDYLFAQVVVEDAIVDTGPTCGNMLSGIGPYAIEQGLVPASDPETVVRIYNVNINAMIEAIVQTPGGEVTYEGDTAIDGVPGTAAAVPLAFTGCVGSKTGKLLPTGNVRDLIGGIEVSCVDVVMPCVIAHASDMGKTGYETKAELDADADFFRRLEDIRLQASELMGMGDATGRVIPKFVIVAAPKAGGAFAGRYFVPTSTHAGMALSGSLCLASASMIKGSTVEDIANVPEGTAVPDGVRRRFKIEHPLGLIEVMLETAGTDEAPDILRAATVRTCRRLFEGQVLVPATVWAGKQAAGERAA
ncbi:MAG: 4-oxalomesaconate tautomerase [Alphaproteobacteria bacterium]